MSRRHVLVRLFSLILVALFVGPFTVPVKAQAGAAAQYVALLGILQTLRANLDAVINTVNQDTADRIRQLEIATDNSIKTLQETIKQINAGISVQREEIFRQTFDVLASANRELQKSSRLLFIQANSTLVQAATIIGSLPFVNVPDYIFAADPARLSPRSVNRLVSLYGYFPDVKNSGDAVVVIGDEEFPLKRYTGFQLGFELPPKYIQREQTYVEMTIKLPRPTWYALSRPTVNNRIYIEKTQPFAFDIRILKENPSLWASFGAPKQHFDNADSGKTSVRKTLTATDLFSTLVNNDHDYVMNTAQFETVSTTVTPGGKPCDCCDGPSGSLLRWQASELEYALSAPTCGAHWCNWKYYCGGGGSNVEIHISCRFRVKKRGVPETVVEATQYATLARFDSSLVKIANSAWTTLEVTGKYKDGDESLTDTVSVTRQVPVQTSPLFTARFDGADGLRLTTRQ